MHALPKRIRDNRAIEHRAVHNHCLGFPAIDDNPAAGGREDLRAMDPPNDRLLARDDVEDPRSYEPTALDRLADFAMLFEQGDLIACPRDLTRSVPAGGARAHDDDVELPRPRDQADPLTPSPS